MQSRILTEVLSLFSSTHLPAPWDPQLQRLRVRETHTLRHPLNPAGWKPTVSPRGGGSWILTGKRLATLCG